MRSTGSGIPWILCVVALLIAVLAVARFELESHARRAGERLLGNLKSLRIGDPAVPVIEKIVRDYHGRTVDPSSDLCKNADACYEIYAGPPLDLDRFLLDYPPLQRWAGLRPWEIDALLEVTKGQLSHVRVGVGASTGKGNEVLDTSTTLEPGTTPPSYSAIYRLRQGYSQALRININSVATPPDREKAFDFDLACATAYSGCRRVCELVPSAWREYRENPTPGGTPISNGEANDPRCEKAEATLSQP